MVGRRPIQQPTQKIGKLAFDDFDQIMPVRKPSFRHSRTAKKRSFVERRVVHRTEYPARHRVKIAGRDDPTHPRNHYGYPELFVASHVLICGRFFPSGGEVRLRTTGFPHCLVVDRPERFLRQFRIEILIRR
jgi:hypothetical protein